MPLTAANSSWSGGHPSARGSPSPVRTGLYARTRSPAAAIAASRAALSTVLPTPVSVAVTSRPRASAPRRALSRAGDLLLALVVKRGAQPGRWAALEVKQRRGGEHLGLELGCVLLAGIFGPLLLDRRPG